MELVETVGKVAFTCSLDRGCVRFDGRRARLALVDFIVHRVLLLMCISHLQILLLPQPPFRPIYYTLVIMDLCKVCLFFSSTSLSHDSYQYLGYEGHLNS